MVRSFYGGDNEWNRDDHILCAAGITVVSPSVRGSSGFGKDFAALNDRDLGGDEIVDLFWVARWIEQQLHIPASRIGVYGRSHGGYATMRAMTFPPSTNGRNEHYRFAFGLAEAGFGPNNLPPHEAAFSVNNVSVPLTPAERKKYAGYVAREYEAALGGLPDLSGVPDQKREDRVRKALERAREKARERVKREAGR